MNNKYFEEALSLHKETIIILAHCDTILHLIEGPMIKKEKVRKLNEERGHVNIPKLKKAYIDCVIFPIYVETFFKPERATERALCLMESFFREVEENANDIEIAKTKGDIKRIIEGGKICGILALEGAEPIQYHLNLLYMFYRLGVRCISLTWNERNMLADGVWENTARSGLTSRGITYVKEMEKLGVIIDVSHLSDSCFWSLIEIVSSPIIASHSNCRAICNSPRNLTDDQIKAIADKDGVIGINFAPSFLTNSGKASIDDVVKHIEHIVEIAGINHVGLGTDYDGISSTPNGLEDVSKLPNLTAKLLEYGYSEKEIKKILGLNFMRVFEKVLK